MYNKKSKASAIITIVSAILVLGIMIMLPILFKFTKLEGWDSLNLIVAMIYGFFPLYIAGIIYVIVGFVYGSRMRKQQLRKKLISHNLAMLITSIVIIPLFAWGLAACWGMMFNSVLGVFPTIYVLATMAMYLASLITNIVTVVKLKKMPDEVAATATAETEPTVTE